MIPGRDRGVVQRQLQSYVPVTLSSDRTGLVMETNADVMLRGVQVGRVSQIGGGKDGASLKLEIDPDQIRYIPANVEAQISATTAFGTKFVELVYPTNPSAEATDRRRGAAFDECEHRDQHGLRERCRAAEAG